MTRRLVAALVVLVLLAAGCSGGGDPQAAPGASSSGPGQGPAPVVALLYQAIDAQADVATRLGRADIVVTASQRDEAGAIDAIHRSAGKAYRYVEFYWAPSSAPYEGFDLQAHPEDAFCGADGKPLVGRTVGATPWWFLDANERAVRDAVNQRLEDLHQAGWDGVMFDRGWAATQSGTDATGADVWSASSTCTTDPVTPGASFSDAYVSLLGLARQDGLGVVLNTGTAPSDPTVPLRPDPHDARCQTHQWADCHFLQDVAGDIDVALDEAPAHPQDQSWASDFEANRRNEADNEAGRSVAGLITQGTLGGSTGPQDVYFQWSRVRLFDVPTTVGTGDDGCPNAAPGAICNRFAIYPQLTSARLGRPLDPQPVSASCDDQIHCLWYRIYQHGVVLVNNSGSPKASGPIDLGSCAVLTDARTGQPFDGTQCQSTLSTTVPAWTGLPLLAD